MIDNSDIVVTEDGCVCSLVTFDDAILRLSWKPFVTTTTSPWMLSLAHFTICWKSGVPASRARVLRVGDMVCSGIDPTVRTQSCQLLEVISGSFTQGSFRRLLCWWLRPSHQRDKAVEQRWGDSQRVARGRRFWKRIGGTLGSKIRTTLTFLSAPSNQRRCHLTPCARTSSRSTSSWRCTMPCLIPVLATELHVERMNVKQGDWSWRGKTVDQNQRTRSVSFYAQNLVQHKPV